LAARIGDERAGGFPARQVAAEQQRNETEYDNERCHDESRSHSPGRRMSLFRNHIIGMPFGPGSYTGFSITNAENSPSVSTRVCSGPGSAATHPVQFPALAHRGCGVPGQARGGSFCSCQPPSIGMMLSARGGPAAHPSRRVASSASAAIEAASSVCASLNRFRIVPPGRIEAPHLIGEIEEASGQSAGDAGVRGLRVDRAHPKNRRPRESK
jgi:hypothetical protein